MLKSLQVSIQQALTQYLGIILKSDSHVSENFYQIEIFLGLVRKNTMICLVLKIENKWILKLQILFSWKKGWFKKQTVPDFDVSY